MKQLPPAFYKRTDVVTIAKELLGKVLVTAWNGQRTSGRIVETEAYAGEGDMASHASKGKTSRTAVMYGPAGRAYVYLCYGVHQMFNIVTSKEGEPHAILIRAIEPIEGRDIMLRRTGKTKWDPAITSGPGKVGKALGFHTSQCGLSLNSPQLYIADDGFVLSENEIITAPRIGVDYAGEHAQWHYRFYIRDNPYVSGMKAKSKFKGKS